PGRWRDGDLPDMRLTFLRAGEEYFPRAPLLGHSSRLHRPVQPVGGVRSDGSSAFDSSHPPVLDAVASGSDKQQMVAIRRPNRITRKPEIGLDPHGLASLRGDDEDLAAAEGRARVLGSGELRERDPLAVG